MQTPLTKSSHSSCLYFKILKGANGLLLHIPQVKHLHEDCGTNYGCHLPKEMPKKQICKAGTKLCEG